MTFEREKTSNFDFGAGKFVGTKCTACCIILFVKELYINSLSLVEQIFERETFYS